jgi:ribosomal protein S27E
VEWPLLGDSDPDGELELTCPNCGHDAWLPTKGDHGDLLIATIGLALVFDHSGHQPPEVFMPADIQCRKCRNQFTSDRAWQWVETA